MTQSPTFGGSPTRAYTWNTENLPTAISGSGGGGDYSEQYDYDGDGERIRKSSGVNTYYFGGVYEEEVGQNNNTTRYYYTLSGQTVAQRENHLVNNKLVSTLTYMSSDHLGSVSLTTNSYGQSAGVQEFDPWGKVRSGGTVGTQTRMNYTGQKLDDSGLLYYHARMYDPGVGRFVSPDSIVPGASSGQGGAGGTVGQEQNSKLTVDFHETGFLSASNAENGLVLSKGFWSGDTHPDGPTDPQALNRYSYVQDNPLRYIDITGHLSMSARDAAHLSLILEVLIKATETSSKENFWKNVADIAKDIAYDAVAAKIVKGIAGAHLGEGVSGGASTALASFASGLFQGVDELLDNITNGGREKLLIFLHWLKDQLDHFTNYVLDQRLDPDHEWISFYLELSCYCIGVQNSVNSYTYGEENPLSVGLTIWYQVFNGEIADLHITWRSSSSGREE